MLSDLFGDHPWLRLNLIWSFWRSPLASAKSYLTFLKVTLALAKSYSTFSKVFLAPARTILNPCDHFDKLSLIWILHTETIWHILCSPLARHGQCSGAGMIWTRRKSSSGKHAEGPGVPSRKEKLIQETCPAHQHLACSAITIYFCFHVGIHESVNY
jgi:hypothetical protein